MQANPPRADTALASSDIRAAWAFRRRVDSMAGDDMDRMVNGGLPPAASGASSCAAGRSRLRLRPPRQARGLSPPVFQRQRQLLGGLDAIAATALGLIERGVGRRQQYFELGARRPAGDADADGGVDRRRPRHTIPDLSNASRTRSATTTPSSSEQGSNAANSSPPIRPERSLMRSVLITTGRTV